MTTDKIDIAVVATQQQSLKQAVETIDNLRLSATKARDVFNSYSMTFRTLGTEIQASSKQMAQFFRDLGRYSKGSFNAQIINSEISKAINQTKAQFRDLNSAVTNEQARALQEQIRAFKNMNVAKSLGLDSVSGPVKNIGEISERLKMITEEQKKQVATQTRLNSLTQQYQNSLIKFQARGEVSKGISSDAVLKGQVDLARQRNLLELNGVQIKKAQAAEDTKLLSILRDRRAYLENIVLQQQKSLAVSKQEVAAQSKVNLSDQQRRQQRVDFITGDSGASLFKIQGALLVNYALMNQLFKLYGFGTQYVLQFDKSLQNLQAIIEATNGQMTTLKGTIIDVSQGTKFSAIQVSQAAEILGQAGFTVDQINESLKGVVLLATATGSTLEQSVDVASSAVSVFNLRAEDMTHVANVMTGAINLTKLTMDKLATGLQYAGNIASEAGLSFEETVSVLGAMANSGIRSGSILGTGFRQLLTELIAPTDKFKKSLKDVGLTFGDVDVKSKGIVGVLNTLRDAGFTASDAFESLDLRAAAAFAAMQNNPETIDALQQSFIYSSAAAKANEVQMKSLSNTFDQFKTILGNFIMAGSGPVVETLVMLTKNLGSLLSVATQLPAVMELLGSAIVSFGAAVVTVKLGGLLGNLLLAKPAIEGATKAVVGATIATRIFGTTLATILSPIGLITFGLTALIGGFQLFNYVTGEATTNLDNLQTNMAKAQGEFDATNATVNTIDESIDRLTGRFAELEKHPETVRTEFLSLQSRFGDLGFKIENETTPTIEALIVALQKLRNELKEMSTKQLASTLTDMGVLLNEQAKAASAKLQANLPKSTAFRPGSGRGGSGSSRVSVRGYQDDLVNRGNDVTVQALAAIRAVEQADANAQDIGSVKLNELQVTAQAAISKIYESQTELGKQISALGAEASRGVDINENQLNAYRTSKEKNDASLAELSTLMTTLKDIQAKRGLAVSTAFETSDLSTKYMERINKFKTEVSSLKDDINQEKDKGKKDKLRNDLKLLDETLKKDLENIVTTNLDATKSLIEGSFGPQSQSSMDNQLANLKTLADNTIKESNKVVLDQAKDEADEAAKFAKEQAKEANEQARKMREQERLLNEASKDAIKASNTMMDTAGNLVLKQKTTFEHIADSYQNEINRLDMITREATDLERGGLAGRYTDAELSMFEDRKKLAKINSARDQLRQGNQYLSSYDNLAMVQAREIEKIRSVANINPTEENQAAVVAAEKDLLKTQRERADLLEKLGILQNDLNAMTGVSTEQNIALGDQIGYVMNQYRDLMAIQTQVGYNIQANLTSMLDRGRESFSGFLSDWLSGTKSMASSWKDMVRSMLEDALKMQTNMVAKQIFGGFAGMIGNLFTPSFSSVSGNIAASTAGIPGLATGGMIRAAAGYSNQNRDSVPILARPGEYLLRNQAVDMIGRQNLDMINAMGNRTISASAPQTGAGLGTGGGMSAVNVYVVSPDQKPGLTKNDVLVTITDDLQRGGPTKKLVKSIIMGQ